MPNRYIRDGLLDSEALLQAGEPAETLFVRLLLVADDFARFDGRVTVICRRCWPNGGPQEDDVEQRLQALGRERLIVLYEIEGKRFIYIPKFNQRTRAGKSKYPDPPREVLADYPHTTDNGPARDWHTPDDSQSSASGVRVRGTSTGISTSTVETRDSAAPAVDNPKPPEEKSSSKPRATTTSEARAKEQLKAQRAAKDQAVAMPPAVRAKVRATAGAAAPPWWTTPAGVAAKGREQDMVRSPNEEPVVFKCRLLARLGDGPWMEGLTKVERSLVDRLRAKEPEGLRKEPQVGHGG